MTSLEHDVVEELRAAGLVPTIQRRLVLTALEGRQRPASAIDIHEHLRRQGHTIGLSTVYRTLHALTEAHLLHVYSRDDEQTYRHCRQEPHQHLVCEVCGLVIEHVAEAMARWLEQLRVDEDFVPDPHRSDLRGVCGACFRMSSCHHWPADATSGSETGRHLRPGKERNSYHA